MSNQVLNWAMQVGLGKADADEGQRVAVERLLQAEVDRHEAIAELLRSFAAGGTNAKFAATMPGPRSLTPSQVKILWDGVNESGQRILAQFAVHGGSVSVDDLMRVIGAEEPRLLNGPLGGISRRFKKLVGSRDATFYAIDPETGHYALPADTAAALMDLIEARRPDWLAEGALTNSR